MERAEELPTERQPTQRQRTEGLRTEGLMDSLDTVRWIHGSPPGEPNTDPAIQVYRRDRNTFVLRQNKAVHYEAPFIYLLCGDDRALLLDTGATADPDRFPLRHTVDALLDDCLAERDGTTSEPIRTAAEPVRTTSKHAATTSKHDGTPTERIRTPYALLVAHTHGHSDHIAADAQFDGRPDTTVVGTDLDAVGSFFGFTAWPDQTVPFDLGGRRLEVTGIPGHHPTSIAFFDPATDWLLTGDTVYRGRLYVEDFATFTASLDRLVAITKSRPVTRIMGCHIEMTRTPGQDYPLGATYQPDEPPLPMTVTQLIAVRDAARLVAERPAVQQFDDFVIFPE